MKNNFPAIRLWCLRVIISTSISYHEHNGLSVRWLQEVWVVLVQGRRRSDFHIKFHTLHYLSVFSFSSQPISEILLDRKYKNQISTYAPMTGLLFFLFEIVLFTFLLPFIFDLMENNIIIIKLISPTLFIPYYYAYID